MTADARATLARALQTAEHDLRALLLAQGWMHKEINADRRMRAIAAALRATGGAS
jgi:hypothetical protein